MTIRTKDDEINALKEGLSACRALAEQQRKTCKSVLDGLRSQHKAKDAEIARLRAALKPFAELASVYATLADKGRWHDDRILVSVDDRNISIADCRSAIKALEDV